MGRGLYKRKIQRKLEAEQIKNEQEQEPMNTAPVPQFKVQINHPSLRIRKAPDSGAEVIGLITDQGVYEIFDTQNNWGKISDNAWIMLTYTKKLGA